METNAAGRKPQDPKRHGQNSTVDREEVLHMVLLHIRKRKMLFIIEEGSSSKKIHQILCHLQCSQFRSRCQCSIPVPHEMKAVRGNESSKTLVTWFKGYPSRIFSPRMNSDSMRWSRCTLDY